MSSVANDGLRQISNNTGYFIPLSSLAGIVYAYNSSASTFSAAQWAATGTYVPSVTSLLRDQGKTIVSAARTFRKVQLVVSGQPSTFGVMGASGLANGTAGDYLTGYIELGFEGVGVRAPVALYGR